MPYGGLRGRWARSVNFTRARRCEKKLSGCHKADISTPGECRGRGPSAASYREAMTQMTMGGAGVRRSRTKSSQKQAAAAAMLYPQKKGWPQKGSSSDCYATGVKGESQSPKQSQDRRTGPRTCSERRERNRSSRNGNRSQDRKRASSQGKC